MTRSRKPRWVPLREVLDYVARNGIDPLQNPGLLQSPMPPARDLDPAAKAVNSVRRGPGRPPRTMEGFHAEYLAAEERCGPEATDQELAPAMGISEGWFKELVGRFGRPH